MTGDDPNAAAGAGYPASLSESKGQGPLVEQGLLSVWYDPIPGKRLRRMYEPNCPRGTGGFTRFLACSVAIPDPRSNKR